MITFVLMFFIALFMVINIIVGCYVAIRLGYGPPNWQTALNQAVRLTTLQNYLNEGRDWLEKKAPWAERLLHRLHVPKPIIFVDVTVIEDEEEEEEGAEEKFEENEENETDGNIDGKKEEVTNEIVGELSGEHVEKLMDTLDSPA